MDRGTLSARPIFGLANCVDARGHKPREPMRRHYHHETAYCDGTRVVTRHGGHGLWSVEMNRARTSDGGGVTLASLAGKFASKGSGSYTICFGASLSATVDCASSPHQEVPFNMTAVAHGTRDAAGNSCGVTALTITPTDARVFGTYFTRLNFARTNVSNTISFDPTTGSGSSSFNQYRGGRCVGAVFDSTGAVLTGTGMQSFMVSDSGNRIDNIVTSFSMVTSPFGVAGSMKETMPAIKDHFHQRVGLRAEVGCVSSSPKRKIERAIVAKVKLGSHAASQAGIIAERPSEDVSPSASQ